MAVYTSNGTGGGLWSAGTTWAGGVKPPSASGHSIIIALGDIVTYDEASGEYGDDTATAITVNGTLKASRTISTSLTVVGRILTAAATTATFDWGRRSTADPIPSGVSAVLILNKSSVNANFKYGLYIGNTSNAYFCGATKTRNTTTTTLLSSSGTSVSVADITGWNIGDTIFFQATDGTHNHYDKKVLTSITPGAGTTGTIGWASGVTYSHASGCNVGNFTSNVTVKSFNNSFPGYVCFFNNSTASNNRREVDYVAFEYIGSDTSDPVNKATISSTITQTSPFVTFTNNSFYEGNSVSVALWIYLLNPPTTFTLQNLLFLSDSGSGGTMISHAGGATVGVQDSVFYRNSGSLATSSYSQGSQGVFWTNCYFCSTSTHLISHINGDGITYTNCKFHTAPASTALVYLQCGTVNFDNCSFASSDLVGSPSAPYIANASTIAGQAYQGIMSNCNFGNPTSSFYQNITTANTVYKMTVLNKNLDSTEQEIYKKTGSIIRDNSTYTRSLSSERFEPKIANTAHTKTYDVPAPNNVPRRVIGFLRYDSTYGTATPPSITLSGLGITPVSYTAGGTANTWYQFDLSATQTSGNDGSLTLTVSGQSTSTTGLYWVSGVYDSPFITMSRHYGFVFDTNIYRTVNSVIQQTNESTVGAYTGISINHGTQTITVTSNHSIREIYDYCYYNLCQNSNLGYPEFFTSTDGINFTSTYNLTLNGGSITGTGNLNLGSNTFTRTGSETSSVPITSNSGAAVFGNITVSGLVANSRVRLNNTTDNIEIYNAVVASTSVSIPATWTANKTLDLRVTYVSGTSAYLPYQAAGTLTSTLPSFTVSQVVDSVYNSNAIDGSTVTEFITDYPNIQIDINDSDGVTSVQRLYAWFQYSTHTSQGIVYYFNGIVAQDTINYKITVSIVDILLDNTNPSSLPVKITGAYLFRDDGTTVIYSGSKSIQLDPNKAYIANSTQILNNTNLIPALL